MVRALAVSVVLAVLTACPKGASHGPPLAPAAPPPAPVAPAPAGPATCDEARTLATAAWTRHRDRLAPLAIRALADATPAIVALADAYIGYLEDLVADRRGPASLAREAAALRARFTELPPFVAADIPDVMTAEQRHLALLGGARRLETLVVLLLKTELRYVSDSDRSRARKASLKQLGEARVAALKAAREVHDRWRLAEIAARTPELAAVATTAETLGTTEEMPDARAATRQALTLCAPAAPPPTTAAAPPAPGPHIGFGPEQWRAHLEDSGYVPTHSGGILEVGTGRARLVVIGGPLAVVALDPARGKPRWRRAFNSGGEGRWRSHQSPGGNLRWPRLVAHAETLFALDADYVLHALDPRTGDDRYTLELAGGIVTPPVLIRDRLYVVSRYGELVALDPRDGRRLYTRLVGETSTAPVAAGDTLFMVDDDGYVTAVDSRTGDFTWLTRPIREVEAGPVLVGDTLVFAEPGGTLHALATATGAPRWTRAITAAPAALVGLEEAVLFLGERGTLISVDARTGEPRWSREYPYAANDATDERPQATVVAPPAVHGDTLLLSFRSPLTLAALDVRTGLALAGQHSPDGSSPVTPLGVGDGRLYAFTAQSNLVAYTSRPVP
ncbi:outer membrane protein assembly factor BamB [Archangium gephyra]|uniref:Cell surface protein/ lipoprotein n=1 Tax=Archangium gephyra TaxID=48 RepID=A0AAC8TIM8_9BACT|nr:PQQ-binding-like beta-propeller repeat protein [Archangium gephyra]AKJ07527.1 Putative cell surface protein/ lipoprotein [Archangium gephyra]REG19078.1 outer membrane protein assembly factor BamB [Archangium gephyra]